jgi:hypothetical protein
MTDRDANKKTGNTWLSNPVWASIRAPQPPHGKFDVAVGQFTPALDFAHIGLLREPLEEGACCFPGGFARLPELLADESIVQPLPNPAFGHSACEVTWQARHRDNSTLETLL